MAAAVVMALVRGLDCTPDCCSRSFTMDSMMARHCAMHSAVVAVRVMTLSDVPGAISCSCNLLYEKGG